MIYLFGNLFLATAALKFCLRLVAMKLVDDDDDDLKTMQASFCLETWTNSLAQ